MNNTTFADVFDESQLETFLFRLRHFKDGTFLPLFSRHDTITVDKALLWRRWMRDLGLDDMAAELDPYAAMADLIDLTSSPT